MLYTFIVFVVGIYVGQEYPIYSVKETVCGLFLKKRDMSVFDYILSQLKKSK
jgi:hypothetical protein